MAMDQARIDRGAARRRARGGSVAGPLVLLVMVGLAVASQRPTAPTTVGGDNIAALPGATAEVHDTMEPKPTPREHPLTLDEIRELLESQAAKPRFDAEVLGWRVAPYRVLKAEGIDDPNPGTSCDARQAGPETATDLDVVVGYLPTDLKIGPISVEKWLCGDQGFSVSYSYSVAGSLGASQIVIQRFVQTRRIMELDVPLDSVEASSVNGKPAIVVHPADDATGLGLGLVLILEDDAEAPFTVLRIYSDDAVPFDELLRIAEGVK